MKIQLASPAPRGMLNGNRVLAERWAAMLTALGHSVEISSTSPDPPADLLIAVHAKRSAPVIARYARRHGDRPIVVILAGTDVYGALQEGDRDTLASIERADLLVTLQPLAVRELDAAAADRVRVVMQSATPGTAPARSPGRRFDVAMVGNVRRLKDHLTAVRALELLPPLSRVKLLHVGAAIETNLAECLRAESRRGGRYRWLGSLGHSRTKELIAGCQLLLHPSRREGGANVISEALVAGVPVLASRIPGSVGLLGTGYPGYFPTGDARRLAERIAEAENDRAYYAGLRARCRHLAAAFHPQAELEAIRRVVEEATAVGRPRKPTTARQG